MDFSCKCNFTSCTFCSIIFWIATITFIFILLGILKPFEGPITITDERHVNDISHSNNGWIFERQEIHDTEKYKSVSITYHPDNPAYHLISLRGNNPFKSLIEFIQHFRFKGQLAKSDNHPQPPTKPVIVCQKKSYKDRYMKDIGWWNKHIVMGQYSFNEDNCENYYPGSSEYYRLSQDGHYNHLHRYLN